MIKIKFSGNVAVFGTVFWNGEYRFFDYLSNQTLIEQLQRYVYRVTHCWVCSTVLFWLLFFFSALSSSLFVRQPAAFFILFLAICATISIVNFHNNGRGRHRERGRLKGRVRGGEKSLSERRREYDRCTYRANRWRPRMSSPVRPQKDPQSLMRPGTDCQCDEGCAPCKWRDRRGCCRQPRGELFDQLYLLIKMYRRCFVVEVTRVSLSLSPPLSIYLWVRVSVFVFVFV